MTKPRLTKEHQQLTINTRDAINALSPGAGNGFFEQITHSPVAWDGEICLSHSGVLKRAFCWSHTLQGYSFWESIWKELVAQEERDES